MTDWQFYIDQDRRLIDERVAKPVRDAAIIRLLIIKDGPRDLRKVEAIIEELKRKKDNALLVLDSLHYLNELEGYEMLRGIIEQSASNVMQESLMQYNGCYKPY